MALQGYPPHPALPPPIENIVTDRDFLDGQIYFVLLSVFSIGRQSVNTFRTLFDRLSLLSWEGKRKPVLRAREPGGPGRAARLRPEGGSPAQELGAQWRLSPSLQGYRGRYCILEMFFPQMCSFLPNI